MSTDVIISIKKIPKAVAHGKIPIANIVIDCAVLEDGSQVITTKSILKFMGRSNGGGRPTKEILALRDSGIKIPVFVAANNLRPFLHKNLSSRDSHILFTPLKGGRGHGYKADVISDICETYGDAMKCHLMNMSCGKSAILTKDQVAIANTLEIISKGLTRVGIKGLVNEACGIISDDKELLQKTLKLYVNSELLKWVKRFPDHFFKKYREMYGIKEGQKIPSHIGTFINNYIYGELAPGVLEELRRLNPKDENGKRAHTHHQLLTPEKGIQELDKQLIKVCTVMSLGENIKDFNKNYKKVKEIENER